MKLRIKKILFWVVISLIPIIFASCLSIYAYRQYYRRYIINLETRIVQENDNVASAYVIYDIGDWTDIELHILIMFKDNQWIQLFNVTKTQERISIWDVNGYEIFHYARTMNAEGERLYNIRFYSPKIEYYLKEMLDMKFENLNQIIQNFDKIAAFMNSVEDITSEKFQNKSIEWFWSDEADLKRIKMWNYAESAWSDEGILFKSPVAQRHAKPQVSTFGRRIEW